MSTVIVVIAYNNWLWTERTLEALGLTTTPYREKPIILVDNGSSPHDAELMAAWCNSNDAKLLRIDENVGYLKAANTGLQAALDAGHEFVLLSNNDIDIPYQDRMWLGRLQKHMDDPAVGAVGPVSNYVMGLQNAEFDQHPEIPTGYRLARVHETRFLIYFFILLRASALREVGLLDERYGKGGNDDLDHSLALRQARYKLLVDRDVFVTHYGSKTIMADWGGPEGYHAQNEATRVQLIEKWGTQRVQDMFDIHLELEAINANGKDGVPDPHAQPELHEPA